MGFVEKTDGGRFRAYFRDPSGKQRSKTFRTKKEASAFLAETETAKVRGSTSRRTRVGPCSATTPASGWRRGT